DGYAPVSDAAASAAADSTLVDGSLFSINGYVVDLHGVAADGTGTGIVFTEIAGDITYSDNPTPGVEPTFTRSVYALPNGVGINIDGSVSGLSGDLEATAFDDVYLVDESTSMSDCTAEPSGVISVLEKDSGAWID